MESDSHSSTTYGKPTMAITLAGSEEYDLPGLGQDPEVHFFKTYKLPNGRECECKSAFLSIRQKNSPEAKKFKVPLTRISKLDTSERDYLVFRDTNARHILEATTLIQGSTLEKPVVLLILASANTIRLCKICRDGLSSTFGISRNWWSDYMRKMNGYFGYDSIYDDDEAESLPPKATTSWMRLMSKKCISEKNYKWVKINYFTYVNHKTGATAIFSFDTPSELDDTTFTLALPPHEITTFSVAPPATGPQTLENILLQGFTPLQLKHPFWMYQNTIQEFLHIQVDSIWLLRCLVRNCESDYKHRLPGQKSFADLNVIARHGIHILETGKLAVINIKQLIEALGEFNAQCKEHLRYLDSPGVQNSWMPKKLIRLKVLQSVQNSLGDIASINLRADAAYTRLQSEIPLAFNIMMQTDSQSMKTIAVLTMVFLPPAFVATLFGTSFFDEGTGHPNGNFKWFWIVAMPTTFVVVGLWFIWHYLKLSREAVLRNMTLKESIQHGWKMLKMKYMKAEQKLP